MKNLEWVFKLTDKVSPAAQDIAKSLNSVKKSLDTISGSVALPGLEKTAKALGGMAKGFAELGKTTNVHQILNEIANELPTLAVAASLTEKEIGNLGKAFGQMSGKRLAEVNQQLPNLSRQLNSFRVNTNSITGISMLSKSMGTLGTAFGKLNPAKLSDFGVAFKNVVPSLNGLRINTNSVTGIIAISTGLSQLASAIKKMAPNIAPVVSNLAMLNGVQLGGVVAELEALQNQMSAMMDDLYKFKRYMASLANALNKIGATNIANLKDININVRNVTGGGGGGAGGGGGPRDKRKRKNALGGDLRFGNLVGYPAGVLSSIGGALGNRAFSGLSLAGRFMSSAGPLVASLSGLTAAVIALKNTFLGIAEQERNLMKMGTLFGGQQNAQRAMTWAIDFAAKTPFELGGVISAISKLRGSAQLTEKEITPIMQSMADLGAATGMTADKMSGAMEQLVQMIGLGTAHLEELNIIAENGIPIFQAIADSTGLSMKQIREATSKNMLSATTVSNALIKFSRKNYFGAAEKGAQTLSGLMEQLASRATYFNLLMAMGPLNGEPDLLKNFRIFLKNLVDLSDPKKEPGATIFKNISKIIQTVDTVLFGGLSKLTDPKVATDKILQFFDVLNAQLKDMKPMLDDVKDILDDLYKILIKITPIAFMMKNAVNAMVDAYYRLDPNVQDGIKNMIAWGIAIRFATGIVGRIITAFKGIQGAWAVVKGIFQSIPGIVGKVITFFKGIPGMFVNLFGLIARFGVMLLTNPLTWWVAAGLLAVGLLVSGVAKHWDAISAKLSEWWNNLTSWWDDRVAWFQSLGSNLGNNIVLGFFQALGTLIPGLYPIMQMAIQTMKDAWGIASPSKVAFGMGENVGIGFMNGLTANYGLPSGLVPAMAGPASPFVQPPTPIPGAQVNSAPNISVSINVNGNSSDAKTVAEEVRKVAVSAVLEALETAASEAGIWQ